MKSTSENYNSMSPLFYLSVGSTTAVLIVSVFSLFQSAPLLILLGLGGIAISLIQFIIESGWVYVTTVNSGVNFANFQEKIQHAMSRRGSGWFYVQVLIDLVYIIVMIMVRG